MLSLNSKFYAIIALSLISLIVGLKFGSIPISSSNFLHSISIKQGLYYQIIIHLRLPRVATAFVTGGLLSLAGLLLQILLRNPLADPYILGVSGGAAVATLTMMALGMNLVWQTTGALGGAFLSMLLVFVLARRLATWSSTLLLLVGVMVASGWSAIICLILTLSPNRSLSSMLFWLLGDLHQTPLIGTAFFILSIGTLLSLFLAKEFNVFSYCPNQAPSLGVNDKYLSYTIYFLSSFLTATAVSMTGTIGFIGLIVPHLVRGTLGHDHRFLIPGVVLLGGSILTFADTLARTLVAPQILPVGVVTSILGIPLFLYLLAKGYRQ